MAGLAFPPWAKAEPAASNATPLTFGIVPQQAVSRLAEQWIPLIAEIQIRSGIPIMFRTAKDIATFQHELTDGLYDFAYMNPADYVRRHDHPGYMAFAHEKNRRLTGVIVVRADSPIQTLRDLAGTTVAFPPPDAFAATMLPRGELTRLNIPFTAKFFASHEAVYLNVIAGHYPAGGGIARTFDTLPSEQRAQLRVIATTPEYTPHPFAVLGRVPPASVERVAKAMLSLNDDDAGRRLLEGASLKGLIAADDKEWNDIRALDLEKLSKLEEPQPE